jgi:hypothetical protein
VCDETKSQLFHAAGVYPDHLKCKLFRPIKEKGEPNENRICKCEELLEQIAQLKDENSKLREENQRLKRKRPSKIFKTPFKR